MTGKKRDVQWEEIISSRKAMLKAIKPTPHPSYALIHDLQGLKRLKRDPIIQQSNCKAEVKEQSHMDLHDIGFVERLRAIGAFSHAVSETIVNAVVAESVAASLDCCVLEILSADGA